MTAPGLQLRTGAVALLVAAIAATASPPAEALNPLRPGCGAAGVISGLAGRACGLAENGRRLLTTGRQLASGQLGRSVGAVVGGASSTFATAAAGAGLAALVLWADGGAQAALRETAHVLASSTTPRLTAPWFTTVYWRVAEISLVLTLPFLFAAAIQAVIRADLALLARAAFGYLPLATLGLALAAQLTALLLALTDVLSTLLADAAGGGPGTLLSRAALAAGTGAIALSPFVACFVAILTVAGAVVLWLEMFMREAAVYVVVLLLPFTFSAFVWPARRVWALRAAELLVALVLCKLVIVAVLTLGAAAFAHSATVTGTLTGLVLLILGVFAPWAMVRLVPFAELADGAVSRIRQEAPVPRSPVGMALAAAEPAEEWARTATARMRREADRVTGEPGPPAGGAHEPARSGPPGEAESVLLGAGAGRDGAARTVPDADDGRGTAHEGEAGAPLDRPNPETGARPASGRGEGDGHGEAAAGDTDIAAPGERVPDMPRRWQAPDWSWRPLHLGLDKGFPPPELWVDPDGEAPTTAVDPPPSEQTELAPNAEPRADDE